MRVDILVLCFVYVSFVLASHQTHQTDQSDGHRADISVMLEIPGARLEKLDHFFKAVSDPRSPSYAKYMTQNEMNQLLQPSPQVVNRVSTFLKSTWGCKSVARPVADRFITALDCDISAHKKDSLAKAKFAARAYTKFVEPPVSGISVFWVDAVHEAHQKIWREALEANVKKTSVVHSVKFSKFSEIEKANYGSESGPTQQRALYGIPAGLQANNTGHTQAVYGAGTYGFVESDMADFYKQFGVNQSPNMVQMKGFAGDPNGNNFIEGTLDAEYISGIGQGVSTMVLNNNNSVACDNGPCFGAANLKFVTTFAKLPTPPAVISLSLGSLSWGACNAMCELQTAGSYSDCMSYLETENSQVCMYGSKSIQDAINVEFQALGSLGSSIFASSGDGGFAWSFGPFTGFSKFAGALNKVACTMSVSVYPSSSPYVTSVGGTMMLNGQLAYCGAEKGCVVSGGGGVSVESPMPSYQSGNSDVTNYIQSQVGNVANFTVTNRVYPDISAIANNVPIVAGGRTMGVGGTSCSAPEAAGLFSLINDARLNSGKSTLGFINPALYQASSSIFVQCTGSSENNCGDSASNCCSSGFTGATGDAYNALCGLGQVDFPSALQYFLSL